MQFNTFISITSVRNKNNAFIGLTSVRNKNNKDINNQMMMCVCVFAGVLACMLVCAYLCECEKVP